MIPLRVKYKLLNDYPVSMSENKGKLLFKKFPDIKIYENGIKFGFIFFKFIPLKNLMGIYKLIFLDYTFEGKRKISDYGYIFQYREPNKKNIIKMGLEGDTYHKDFTEGEFNSILEILRKQIGKKIEKLYNPERYLTIKRTNNKLQYKILEFSM